MSDIVIRAERLGKLYRIGRRDRYRTLRDTLTHALYVPFRAAAFVLGGQQSAGSRAPLDNFIWALKDLSFEVKRGEVVGIIGRNGAGKSTLLKILSQITEPTEGRAGIRGRVGSLLEVGTGFHPELSGRENIYLNGAVLGMKRTEIDRKLDEIVAFAEVEKFLDTPVKHYSSGMYVRLAFAVAAHLEPEILFVDEVLAVGDTQFQKKCLGKMGRVAKEGRTILFVSHSMAAVQSLCSRGIVLQAGEVFFDGSAEKAIERYIQSGPAGERVQDLSKLASRGGNGEMRITAFWMEDSSGEPTSTVLNGKSCTFVIRCEVLEKQNTFNNVAATINVSTILGARVFYHHNLLTGQPFTEVSGQTEFRLHIPRLPLSCGSYFVDLALSRDRGRTVMDLIEGAADFEVCDGDFFNSGFEYVGGLHGPVMVDGTWDFRQV